VELSQVDAAGSSLREHPRRPPEHGKVLVDGLSGFRVLGGVGWGDEVPPNGSA
jgi:hypothetical protein